MATNELVAYIRNQHRRIAKWSLADKEAWYERFPDARRAVEVIVREMEMEMEGE